MLDMIKHRESACPPKITIFTQHPVNPWFQSYCKNEGKTVNNKNAFQ